MDELLSVEECVMAVQHFDVSFCSQLRQLCFTRILKAGSLVSLPNSEGERLKGVNVIVVLMSNLEGCFHIL